MSFASDVRLELARAPEERRENALSELCAYVLCSSGISFKGMGRYGLQIASELQEPMQRYAAMLKRFWNVDAELSLARTDRLGGQTHFVLTPDACLVNEVLVSLDMLDASAAFGLRSAPSVLMLETEPQQRAFLRGAFLACGSISNPEKAYHLEFSLGGQELAHSIARLMELQGLFPKITKRKSQYVVYLKGAEGVADMLRLLGAHRALMMLENVRIVKGVRNDVNRQVNCDQNNLDKTVAAAEKQISVIRAIERYIGMDVLPPSLREIAELRLQYPDVSMSELGLLATPQIGKSGVNARMRKLELLAEETVNG